MTARRTAAVVATGLLSLGIAPAGAAPSPSVPVPMASVVDRVLTVVGTGGADRISLRLGPGAPTALLVDFDGGAAEEVFDRSTFNRIVVRAGSGDDAVRLDEVAGIFLDELVSLEGGGGNDTLSGGNGVETLVGGGGNDVVESNNGRDAVDLGPGQDAFTWGPGDGDDTVEGGAGIDTLRFTGSDVNEEIGLTGVDERARLTRNVAAVTLGMGGVERVAVAALGGADTVRLGDVSATDVQRVDVDLAASAGDGDGDGQLDTVLVTGIVEAPRAGVATVDGRLEIEGLRPAVGVVGGEDTDLLDVTGRPGPGEDVADGMEVAFELVHSGIGPGGG